MISRDRVTTSAPQIKSLSPPLTPLIGHRPRLEHPRPPHRVPTLPVLQIAPVNAVDLRTMKFAVFLATAATGALALRETVQQAALHARSLLHSESILTLSSVFSEAVNPSLSGQPFAYDLFPHALSLFTLPFVACLYRFADVRLTEYYCDCSKDGTPTLLLMDLEITTRNMGHGSPLSLSIDTTPPKGIYSIASLPRMNLNGRMELLQGKKEVLPLFPCPFPAHISVWCLCVLESR